MGGPPSGSAEPRIDPYHEVFEALRGELGVVPPVTPAKPLSRRTCLLAVLPRTGSTALDSLLESSGVLGMPNWYLNGRTPRSPMRNWARRFASTSTAELMDALRRERATANGIFSLSTAWIDFEPLARAGQVEEVLGKVKVAYLTRTDRLSQAISLYGAKQSGLWHRDQRGRAFRSRPHGGEVEFDEAGILAELEHIRMHEERWEQFFAAAGISPLRITYEELEADASAVIGRIARLMGVDWSGRASLAEAKTSRLADDVSAEWARRIRSLPQTQHSVRRAS